VSRKGRAFRVLGGLAFGLKSVYIWFTFGGFMSLERSIQPISYLKSHAATLVDELTASGEPLIVTQNGRAKLVVQDIASYERTQETLALLKLIAMSQKEIDEGKHKPARVAFKELRARLKA
jgi:prevent-host-death family protein